MSDDILRADATAEFTPDASIDEIGAERTTLDPVALTMRCVLALPGIGNWAYYSNTDTRRVVMPDTIFNPHAPHFAGRFEKPWASNTPATVWIITKGWFAPAPERKLYVEDEDLGLPRMEHRDSKQNGAKNP